MEYVRYRMCTRAKSADDRHWEFAVNAPNFEDKNDGEKIGEMLAEIAIEHGLLDQLVGQDTTKSIYMG